MKVWGVLLVGQNQASVCGCVERGSLNGSVLFSVAGGVAGGRADLATSVEAGLV